MSNLPQNANFAFKCTSLLSNEYFFTFFKTKLQIFENMPNLPQNEHFALKCTFYSQIRNMKPSAAKPRIVHCQHINQNTLTLVAVTRNNTASIVKH